MSTICDCTSFFVVVGKVQRQFMASKKAGGGGGGVKEGREREKERESVEREGGRNVSETFVCAACEFLVTGTLRLFRLIVCCTRLGLN